AVGIGMGDRADGRAPIAHRGVRNETQSLAEEGVGPGDVRAAFDPSMCDARTHADLLRSVSARNVELVDSCHGGDVDEVAGSGQAHVEDRDEALASGEDLSGVTSSG